ncbi:MAG TPA: hypothetical protein VJ644_09235 [Jiangellaceae bacterium]|nr:hypothetical protein [Jiangellaceae bacterium]
MSTSTRSVSTAGDLEAAAGDADVRRIVVDGELTGVQPVRLAPGQQLVGAQDAPVVAFAAGVDGLQLSRDNEVSGIRLEVGPEQRAVLNDTAVDDLGTMRLTGITAVGQVQILARDRVRAGHVVVEGLDVVAADVRNRPDRPYLLGVGVVQGAFTLWNLQPDDGVVLTAELRRISAGRDGAPVRGSGVFVGGADAGGRLDVTVLETGPVFTDGGIAEGTRDLISGGVFVISGCHVDEVRNRGRITTHGVNDMALDNWGSVNNWIAEAPITTHGRSGVGFVNFGSTTSLRVTAPIETHGIGARGFNVYTGGSMAVAEFDRITTRADAAIGVQVGEHLGRLVVRGDIHTYGAAGDSLVKGVITRLSAHALSVLAGGSIGEVSVAGALTSTGHGVTTVDVKGEIATMTVHGGIHAQGAGSDAVHVDGGSLGLYDTDVTSGGGAAVRLTRPTRFEHQRATLRGVEGELIRDSAPAADGAAEDG